MGLNHYSELLEYFKTLGEADPFINTITQGDFDRLDLDKGNLMPLLHINILGGSFTNGQTVVLDVEIAALQQRDTNNEERTDKFFQQDNEIDNMNEMLAVLNRIWTTAFRDFTDRNFRASEDPTLEIVDHRTTTNSIEGWNLSFSLIMPNTTISLCP